MNSSPAIDLVLLPASLFRQARRELIRAGLVRASDPADRFELRGVRYAIARPIPADRRNPGEELGETARKRRRSAR